MLGDAIIFIICLNEHTRQTVGSDGVQIPKDGATNAMFSRYFQLGELGESAFRLRLT
jgi:hypothetical protein